MDGKGRHVQPVREDERETAREDALGPWAQSGRVESINGLS